MAGPADAPRPSRRRGGARPEGSGRPAAPRSRLPPRHRRPSKGWFSILPILVIAALFAGRRWLRSEGSRDLGDERLSAERIDELVEEFTPKDVPVADDEKRFLVNAAALAKYGADSPSPDLEEYSKIRSKVAGVLTYAYGSDEIPASLTVTGSLTVLPEESDAVDAYQKFREKLREVAAERGEFEEVESDFGDERFAATVRTDGQASGHVFLCRKKRHLFIFTCRGIALEAAELQELLSPYVERFATWVP